MSKSITIEEGLNILKNNMRLVRQASNGEHIFKCPFCGDSDNPYHAHLYLNNISGIFNCYKCEMSGNINRILYLFEGDKYKVTGLKYQQSTKVNRQSNALASNKTEFERYILIQQLKQSFNPYFDLLKSVESEPVLLYKHNYMMNRIVKNKSIIPMINKTNLSQHLISYYSEYFMEKYLECGSISDRVVKFVNETIINTRTSIMFLGYNKTLASFKNDSKSIKYFKVKNNIFYGPNINWDFFTIINQNKYKESLNDIYSREKVLNVYFCEGVFDALNLYLYNPKYVTGVEPDIVVATGSKVSYASALYFIRDTFMKPVISHVFIDPEIIYRDFIKKYRFLRRVYNKAIVYQNDGFDYGDVTKTDLRKIKVCSIME